MIVDCRYHEINADIEYDICIIGAGAAGISVALELARGSRLNLVILEAGGEHFAHEAQSLLQGDVEGDRQPPLWRARYSGLGGSTQVWAGWCRPLDEWNFASHHYVPDSGWPFGKEELRSAYRRATEICGLGADDFELETWRGELAGQPLSLDPKLQHHIFQVRKLRFNQSYSADLRDAENITLYLYSPVMRLWGSEEGCRVDCVEIGSYKSGATKLRARQFVLATGGIENARLLLLSGSSPENALGNLDDCVGRYYLDHGFIDSGWFLPDGDRRDLRYYFPVSHPHCPDHGVVRPVLTLSPKVLEEEKLLSGGMYFYPSYESHPVFTSEAVKAALELWEIVKGKKLSDLIEIGRTEPALADLMDFGRRICSRPHYVALALYRRARMKGTVCRRWRTRFYYECVPAAENRVMLSDKRDRFGRRCARVQWYLTDQALDSAHRFHVYLNTVLQRTGAGRLVFFDQLSQWRDKTEIGKHPSGTTRMHRDPKKGVVDDKCRVHGLENLYIAGSSIFPTTGYANPTLTIVALAVRLAEHLRNTGAK